MAEGVEKARRNLNEAETGGAVTEDVYKRQAFVVLDPRQEEHYWWGMNEFMRTADADVVFPMHFWKDYKLIEKFKSGESAQDYKEKVVSISEDVYKRQP